MLLGAAGLAPVGAGALPPGSPGGSPGGSTSTVVVTTATATRPGDLPSELARTGPRDHPGSLGVFGFVLIGVGAATLVLSRRLLAHERTRR